MSSLAEFDELRQGDWLTGVASIAITDFAGRVQREVKTPLGVAVITQCCDLANEGSGLAQLARVVTLEGKEYADALSGRTCRYANIDDTHFADLTVVGTVTRESPDKRTTMTADRRVKFAECISRRYSRFAFPDDIVKVLKPLKDKIRDTGARAGSIGTVVRERIADIRLECAPDWEAPRGLSLTLLVLVEVAFLPSVEELEAAEPPGGPKRQRKHGLSGAAEAILRCESHDQRLADAWDEFGGELLSLLESGIPDGPIGYVEEVHVEVLRTDEIHFERYRNTVNLDFDYLSTPRTQTTSPGPTR
ncbi:hypothetical protein [Mycobacterium sp. E3198]|uniref:hypothetical protein n=1 Tax=Mycobacterium sp. E3198 TaxID=1834143 RepID=UPI0012EACBFE|nr:hypothetical protein [Mycobacterium sp. E3198]